MWCIAVHLSGLSRLHVSRCHLRSGTLVHGSRRFLEEVEEGRTLRLQPFTIVFNFAFWGAVKLYVGDSESFPAFSLELLGWPRTWP